MNTEKKRPGVTGPQGGQTSKSGSDQSKPELNSAKQPNKPTALNNVQPRFLGRFGSLVDLKSMSEAERDQFWRDVEADKRAKRARALGDRAAERRYMQSRRVSS